MWEFIKSSWYILHLLVWSLTCSVTIELIQVDGSGKPLSIGETLNNLQKVTEEITKSDLFSGADLEGVSSVNPSEYAPYELYYSVVCISVGLSILVSTPLTQMSYTTL